MPRHDRDAQAAVHELEQGVDVAHLEAHAPRAPARLEGRIGERPHSPRGVEVHMVLDGEGLPRCDGDVGKRMVGGAHEHQVLVAKRLMGQRAQVRGGGHKGDVEGVGA